MPFLPANSLIVVTGITGYIASHVGLAALQAGHRVRGTVRDLAKLEYVRAGYAKQGVDTSPERLDFVVLDDLTSQAQYDAAFKGADGVVHVAVPTLGTPNFVDITIESVMAPLRAAKKVRSMKRFVLTSTAVAAYMPPTPIDHALTGTDWNLEVLKAYENATEELKTQPAWMWICYAAGKTLAELAAFKWVEDEKPSFDLASVLPFANFGPFLYGEPHSSGAWIPALMKGDTTFPKMMPPQWYIDVRDCGRLHIFALTTPSASGQRIWAAAAPFDWNEILVALKNAFPDAHELPENFPPRTLPTQPIDNEFAGRLLGGWISLEKCVVDGVKSVSE